ncbi:transposase, MuDR, plant [Tanacetum coccineum]|uniref:Transposase, MuDR, plant n=1 Tax=Tanacetum coccineum TaxID=301880 RepID=A0ABQ5I0D7_9ASTR
MRALQQFKTCLEDHYGMLWSYASEILNSNPGSTCKMSVDSMPDGKNYFSRFYVCFKGLREGWLQGCRRVIGLDGCFLKTICKGELLSAVGRDVNNQIYPIAWAIVSVKNKDNWTWFMELLINDLGLVSGEGLTIISDQHKGIIEAAKQNLFWKAAKATYPTRFNKVMKEIQSINKEAYKHLMDRQPESWSRAYFSTDKACDADIRVLCMERLQTMREKHAKWTDGICPNIRKRLEKYKDLHRHWNVILSGESRFEVRNGYEGFKVDERSRSCSCKGSQLSGIPCEHGHNQRACPSKPEVTAAGKIMTASVGKVTAAGEIVTASGGNVIASGDLVFAKGENVTARGGKVCARVGKVTARGGIMMASGGNVSAGGRKVTISGGKVTVRGRKVFARGGKYLQGVEK